AHVRPPLPDDHDNQCRPERGFQDQHIRAEICRRPRSGGGWIQGETCMTNILVVGGAGYIGSHTCLDLAARGFTPVVYDNLSNGHAEFVKWGPLERGDIRDRKRLASVLETYRPAAIVHFAALIEVGESVRAP